MQRLACGSALSVLLVLAGPLCAQPSGAGEPEPGPKPEAQPGLLAGPEVDHDRPALLEQGLTMQMAPMMAQRRQLPQQQVTQLFRQLEHDSISPGLKLSEEQRAELWRINRDHRRALADYRAEHATLYTALRQAAGYTVPEAERPEPTPEQAAARDRFRELTQAGPTNAQLQARMFAVLTDAQQAWMDARIADILRRSEREAGERRYRNELNAARPVLADYLDAEGNVDLATLPPRLRARLEPMNQARRLAAIKRLLVTRPAGEAGASADRSGDQSGGG